VSGKSVSYPAALKAFKTLLQFSDLDPSLYGLHSPRIGGASDAFHNGIPGHVIDSQGRWKSAATKFRYLRFEEREFVRQIERTSSYR
jgi:hypothetical protein